MKKSLAFIILLNLLIFNSAKAQNWGGGIDDDPLNFGFTFQYVTSEYKLLKKADWKTPLIDSETGMNITSPLRSISSPLSVGFGIGFVVNNNLTRNLDLRLTPNLVFNDRKMQYEYESDEIISKKVQASMVEFPLSLKLKSDRLLNFRAYILGGLKYSIDLASAKKTNNTGVINELDKYLKNKRNYFSYEAGLGMDLYFEWFKMSPEFKVSYSFNDILKHEGNIFDTPIQKAKLRYFTFSLFFE